MATNSTTKKPAAAAAAEESPESVTETAPARPARKQAPTPAVVGPALPLGVDPVTVTLSHHHTIDGADYPPGAEILVSPDYAHRLRTQGYATPA